ncbi:cation transporter, partial [Paraburkholderia sp.]|uniref:P-type ATPase n=1 Tax=Paraburkholderia sp. TaxID=1926495 RepID=UPI0026231148
MPNASHAETHRHEHGESCAHAHSERVSSHEHDDADVAIVQEDEHVHSRDNDYTDACCSIPPVVLATLAGTETIGASVRTSIRIMQMDCPTEEALIRKKLGRMPYVRSLDFNLMQRVLTVVHAPEALGSILASLRSLDFDPQLADATAPLTNPPIAPHKPWWPLALAGAAAVGSEAVSWLGAPVWLAAGLAIVAVLSCGLTTYKKGWLAIRNGNLNINALMSIAVTGALVLRQWPEAAMVMVLFTIAELIEAKSLDRARNAIKGLMQLTPEEASVQQSDGSWRAVDIKSGTRGDIVRVKPGERIGLDGEIVAGRSSVNQAPITGESL